MNEKFMKMMAEKKKEKSSSMTKPEATAKESVLNDLMGLMDKMGGDKVKGLKKVTVASTDTEGLKKGLNKAEDMLGKKSVSQMMSEAETGKKEEDETELDEKLMALAGDDSEESLEDESMETTEHEVGEIDMEECKTPEEVDAKIAKLLKLKEEMKKNA